MVKKKSAIPDAWDDDWEAQADKAEASASSEILEEEPATKITKAERLAKHAESNKKLWDSAETPPVLAPFLQTILTTTPLATTYKPSLTVLARKPAPKTIIKQDPLTGKKIEVFEDEDEEETNINKLTAEEEKIRALREREEKQRKYNEIRAKIFGTGEKDGVAAVGEGIGGVNLSSMGTEGSVRGGKTKRGGRDRDLGESSRRPGSSSSISTGQGQGQKELYDPNYSPKPISIQQRGGGSSSGRSTPREKEESQILRQPRAPDSRGRGGFGRARGRGEKDN